jgi:hypothetical protein
VLRGRPRAVGGELGVGVLDELDTPLERARLARAVIAIRDAGRCGRLLAAVALIDLASGSRQLLCASVIEAVAVRAGVARTPAGVLGGVASDGDAQSFEVSALRCGIEKWISIRFSHKAMDQARGDLDSSDPRSRVEDHPRALDVAPRSP